MSDIVDRLRVPVMLHASADQTNAERREAAAEIARLTRELETMAEEHDAELARHTSIVFRLTRENEALRRTLYDSREYIAHAVEKTGEVWAKDRLDKIDATLGVHEQSTHKEGD